MLPNSNLPGDLVVHILARLPVKSLMRFKCVCKSWYVLLTNPSFTIIHFNHFSNANNSYAHNLLITSFNRSKGSPKFSLRCSKRINEYCVHIDIPFETYSKDFFFLGSCNGLLCVYTFSESSGAFPPKLILWNPATREFNPVPRCPLFDDLNIPFYGLGFDANTNDFKLVRMMINTDEKCNFACKVAVYTLSTNSWRAIKDLSHRDVYENEGRYTNGFLHWMARDEGLVSQDDVLTFDMANEVFGRIELPEYNLSENKHFDHSIELFKGSLAVLVTTGDNGRNMPNTRHDLWVMSEYGVKESWTKQWTIGPFSSLSLCYYLGCLNTGEFMFRKRKTLVLYDSNGKKVGKISARRTKYYDTHYFMANCYIESVFQIKRV